MFNIQGKSITIPSKKSYENKVQDIITIYDEVELSIDKLAKIKKIVRHDEMHGLKVIHDTKKELENDCTFDYPYAFWMREQYYIDIPYCQGYCDKPKKAFANHMSPT
jgi:hypothetical protein